MSGTAWKAPGEVDHPVRVAILEALCWISEPCSAVQLAPCFGERTANVHYHLLVLSEDEQVEVATTHRRRNAVERRYRPVVDGP